MQDEYKTQATEQVQLLRTGQVCDAWTQHGGGPAAHPRSSRSSTIAVEAARLAMASQPRGKRSIRCSALHHTNLLRKLLRNARALRQRQRGLREAGAWGVSEKRAFSELQLTGLRLARRKQEGGPALRAFIFFYPAESTMLLPLDLI